MSVAEIRSAILDLPDEEKTHLAEWIFQLDKMVWDKAIEQDFSSQGSGMDLLKEVDEEINRGDFQSLG